MSAPPEVVFSTATDPDRRSAWLPEGFDLGPTSTGTSAFEVQLTAGTSVTGSLAIQQGDSGGSTVDLTVPDDGGAGPDEILGSLDRAVSDNFNAG
jgi:hypothetical protein